MGLLKNGKWFDHWYDTKKSNGKFIRQDSIFRNHIGSSEFPAEKNRYHLYVSHACPWAHRTVIFRQLKELEPIISLSIVNAYMGDQGWTLSDDPINNKQYLHEIYTLAQPNYSGRVTVPILWDTRKKTIVNNESSEIIRMFNSSFQSFTNIIYDYYPKQHHQKINEINSFIYDNINNGVYKAGFATTQCVYNDAVQELFNALDQIEKILSKQRYLIGNFITESDWRLFTTLIRFDSVYVGHFKCNIKQIESFPNISHYLKDLYQIGNIKKTVFFDHIKEHYYKSHPTINPTGIVPTGPIINYDSKHNRDQLT